MESVSRWLDIVDGSSPYAYITRFVFASTSTVRRIPSHSDGGSRLLGG
jgi:hypothetical protein